MIAFHTDLDNTLIYSYKHDTTVADQCIWKWSDSQINALILFQRPSGRWNNEHFIFYELQEMICFLCDVGYFSSLIEFHISLLRPDVMFLGIDECIIPVDMVRKAIVSKK